MDAGRRRNRTYLRRIFVLYIMLPRNALLIYPEYPDSFWSFKHVMKFLSRKAAFPPLSLMTLGAMLPKEWNIKLVDVNVSLLTDEAIGWADIVFIGGMIVQADSAAEIIHRCKEQSKVVVAGGPLFTTGFEDFPEVDHFVLGEAEITLPLFLQDLEAGNPQHLYQSAERPDVTKTPAPLWSLINFKDYVTMSVQFSRGCPFNCEFCDIIIMNGRTPRTKTSEQLLAEFDGLYAAGWRSSVFIVDDNFIGNKVRAKAMLKALIGWQKEHQYPFKFFTEASTNLADDDEMLDLMSAANFYKVFLGIETPEDATLIHTGKVQNAGRDIVEAVHKINRHGMQVMAGFIVGFDTDTEKIFDTQIHFIQEMGVVTAMVGMLTALPQTRLYNRLKAEGRLVSKSTGGNTDGTLNFIPTLDRGILTDGYKRILTTIYSPTKYYERINTFISHYKPTVRTRLSETDMRAFTRSLWAIGLLSPSRSLYWKLILKTMLKNRKAVPAAVELAIIGLHYEKVTKRTVLA